jgi:hypothetical protein
VSVSMLSGLAELEAMGELAPDEIDGEWSPGIGAREQEEEKEQLWSGALVW